MLWHVRGRRHVGATVLALVVVLGMSKSMRAQNSASPNDAPPGVLPGVKDGGSPNIHLVAHIPLGGYFRVMDDEIEQDPNRPYAYVSHGPGPRGLRDHRSPGSQQRQACSTAGASRTRRCTRRCRRDGRQVLQDQQPVLLRAVAAIRAGDAGCGSRRRRRRRHGPARHEHDQDRGAHRDAPDARAGSTTCSSTATRTAASAVHDRQSAAQPTSTTWPKSSLVRGPGRPGRSARSRCPSRAPDDACSAATGYHDFYVGVRSRDAPGQVLRRGSRRVLRVRHHATSRSRSSLTSITGSAGIRLRAHVHADSGRAIRDH